MWRMLLQGLLDLVWPPRTQCLLCPTPLSGEGPGELLCQACWLSMDFPDSVTICRHCSRPVNEADDLCAACADGSPFGRVFALGLHTGPLREAVHHLKFNGRHRLGELLGERLAVKLPPVWDCMVPVPLHRSRLRERGYNQATMIARGIARQRGWPIVEKGLTRLRGTGHQAKLQRDERIHNLRGAFGVQGDVVWRGKAVLLVDDVLTTGTTAGTIAQVLYDHGAHSVDVAVLAVSTKPVRGNSKIPVNDLRLITDT